MLWMESVCSVRCQATNTNVNTTAYRMVEPV